jgi:hypothetical protein
MRRLYGPFIRQTKVRGLKEISLPRALEEASAEKEGLGEGSSSE